MPRPWTRNAIGTSLILAVLLAAGLGTIWFFTFLTAFSTIVGVRSSSFKQLLFTEDGTALVRVYRTVDRRLEDPSYYTLEGKLVADVEGLNFRPSNDPDIPPENYDPVGIREGSWQDRMTGFAGRSGASRIAWYLIHDGNANGSAYFAGYDTFTKMRTGYLAEDGFHDELPDREVWFKIPLQLFQEGAWAPYMGSRGIRPSTNMDSYKLFLASAGKLLVIDFFEPSVTHIPTPAPVVSLGSYYQLRGAEPAPTRIVVRMPRDLLILSIEGEPVVTLPLSADLTGQLLALTGTESGEIVVQAKPPRDEYGPLAVAWFAADGMPVRRTSVTLQERSVTSIGEGSCLVTALPFPLVLGVIGALMSIPELGGKSFSAVAEGYWLPIGVLVILSLALAIWTYRRHLRYERQGAAAWAVFVLLLGPLGVAAYLMHRSWPVRAACEHCGRPTPRDRAVCLVCEKAFPAPELRGVEVFA